LLGLINTILDVARIEAGRFEMSADRIDLARLVQTCARSSASAFLAGEIALRLDLPDQLPELRADERRLQQVLAGLLSNAVKFTPAGGEVTVGARLDPTGDLLLHVTDTGIGIPPADLERVFEPFIQLDATLSRRFQGAGLGLYVARSLVEAHGGRLRLVSEPGAGTRAEITLPGWRLTRENTSVDETGVNETVA
jgi:signal transduction histidine kinase